MGEPSEDYDWATNANFAGGPDVGTVTKVDPPGAVRQDGWRGNQAPPPQYQNHWQNAVGKWFDWTRAMFGGTEDLDVQPTRTVVIAGNRCQLAGAPDWDSGSGQGAITSVVDTGLAHFDLGRYLPHGAVLTRVKALVTPGAARVGTFKMSLQMRTRVLNFTSPAAPAASVDLAAVFDDGNATLQVIDSGALTVTIASQSIHELTVTAGNTGAASPDTFYGLQLQFDDPGPRNF